jgi:threonine dehydrogenase-like Zn-dependent dehydrogenase
MTSSKLKRYRGVLDPLPEAHLAWPLYGAVLDNLGRHGDSVQRALPAFGPDELLVRHDAVSLCYTDVKEINLGPKHPRLVGRDLACDPIVPGHEASMTVVAVGENLRSEYSVGDRFVIQPDVWYQGRSVPYSFGMDGAYRQYAAIGKEILHGDAGNYLIPVPDDMTYAAAALTEPWACVEASYRVSYRTRLRGGGRAWFVGGDRSGYEIDEIRKAENAPAEVTVTELPADLLTRVRHLAEACGTRLVEARRDAVLGGDSRFDDILVLDGSASDVDAAAPLLAKGGILAIARETPMAQPIHMDLGRVHYDHIVYVGTSGVDLDAAYRKTSVRPELRAHGTTWILGAGGPMGRMHLQRAIQSPRPPARAIATNRGLDRLNALRDSMSGLAQAHGVELLAMSPRHEQQEHDRIMAEVLADGGVDDVEVMAASTQAVVEATRHVARGGVINLFAGLKRGSMAPIQAWQIYGPTQMRIIGHSGSGLDDQVAVVERVRAGQLQPERSVAAIAGFRQFPDGIRAMIAKTYPGKIVVFPLVPDFPLTALADLKRVLPEVYEKLGSGDTWTGEAEAAFLEAMLAG